MRSKYRDSTHFDTRLHESSRVAIAYPDRIPCIIESDDKSTSVSLPKTKYLIPYDLTIGNLSMIVRRHTGLTREDSIFLFIDNVMFPQTALLSEIYKLHKDPDGFLYVKYARENTFGSAFEKALPKPRASALHGAPIKALCNVTQTESKQLVL